MILIVCNKTRDIGISQFYWNKQNNKIFTQKRGTFFFHQYTLFYLHFFLNILNTKNISLFILLLKLNHCIYVTNLKKRKKERLNISLIHFSWELSILFLRFYLSCSVHSSKYILIYLEFNFNLSLYLLRHKLKCMMKMVTLNDNFLYITMKLVWSLFGNKYFICSYVYYIKCLCFLWRKLYNYCLHIRWTS